MFSPLSNRFYFAVFQVDQGHAIELGVAVVTYRVISQQVGLSEKWVKLPNN